MYSCNRCNKHFTRVDQLTRHVATAAHKKHEPLEKRKHSEEEGIYKLYLKNQFIKLINILHEINTNI